MSQQAIDLFAEKLASNSDLRAKHSTLLELLDSVDGIIGSNEYGYYLQKLVPIYFTLLKKVPVGFSITSMEHKLRNCVLELFHRMHCNDVYAPYAGKVLDQMNVILTTDNEDNGVLSMKTIVGIHKVYRNTMYDKVQPFIDIINGMYPSMEAVLASSFSDSGSSEASGSPSVGSDTKHLSPSLRSFRTLAEYPIIFVALLSSYKQLIGTALPVFLPIIIDYLKLEVEPQRRARENAAKDGKVYTKVSPEIKNRALYDDFILSQIKAASFLAYIILRGHCAKILWEKSSEIPDIIVRLLQDCSGDLPSARKELLIATKHILSTSYNTLFLPKLDLFMNMDVLLGDGLTSYETLRSLAYNTAADYLHTARAELTLEQVWKAVDMYSGILKDGTVAVSVQVLSSKLLSNLLERINKLSGTEARRLCFVILDAHYTLYARLNLNYASIMSRHKEFAEDTKDDRNADPIDSPVLPITIDNDETLKIENIIDSEVVKDEDVEMKSADETDVVSSNLDEISFYDLKIALPIQVIEPQALDPLKQARFVFRTVLNFMKIIILLLRQTNPPAPSSDYNSQGWNSVARLFSLEEEEILRNIFRETVKCLRFFQSPESKNIADKSLVFDIGSPNLAISASKEEQELMEIIAAMYSRIDLSTFNEILTLEISFLVEETTNYPPLLYLSHFFLGSEGTSPNYMGIVLSYLEDKLGDLDQENVMLSHVFLRLFKLCLFSLKMYPNFNSPVMLDHIKNLVLKSLKLSTKAENPTIYFYLVRTLLKTISSNKLEALHDSLISLLSGLLSSLEHLILAARTVQERDTYVELCLSIPLKLPKMIPYVKYLMRPMVLALNASPELVAQGLRFLEICVDNMTSEFFDPLLEPFIEDVMKALWKQLQPYPYNYVHSHTAVRILGKLGGRNRDYIRPIHDLEPRDAYNQRLEAAFKVDGADIDQSMSISTGVALAADLLSSISSSDSDTTVHYQINAFKYLSSLLKLFIDGKDISEDYAYLISEGVELVQKDKFEDNKGLGDVAIESQQKLRDQENLSETLLDAIFNAVAISKLKYQAKELLNGICIHFCQLYVIRHVIKKKKNVRKFSVDDNEGKIFLNEHVLLNSIVNAMSSHSKEVRTVAGEMIKRLCKCSVALFNGAVEKSLNFILLRSLLVVFFHACYEELYYKKYGGVLCLKVLINEVDIPISWFSNYQSELVRALFFVLRDAPPNTPIEAVDIAIDLIKTIVKGCNEGVKDFDNLPTNLVTSLVYDLANSKKIIRDTVKQSLELLSEITGISVVDIVTPSKGILLSPVFTKPLRALPLHMQIGNIEAVIYWLSITKENNSLNEELSRLLEEVLTMVNVEDHMLVGPNRLIDHQTKELLTELRVSCVNLLKVVISKPDYPHPQRLKILSVLFKALCCKESVIIEASYEALALPLSENSKLPKQLLQDGLRPMLMNLADYKQLKVSNLQALAKLLVLLTSYFKVEIGNKLMDHLKAWATPLSLYMISHRDLKFNRTVQIVCGILNIFHLLPPKASMFMKDLLAILDYLELHLRRSRGSPFREPIGKYLNRYHKEAFAYFKENFGVRSTKIAYFVKICPLLKTTFVENLTELLDSVKNESDFAVKVMRFANLVDVFEVLSVEESDSSIDTLSDLAWSIVDTHTRDPYNKSYHFQLSSSFAKFQKMYFEYVNSKNEIDKSAVFYQNFAEGNVLMSLDLEQSVLVHIVKNDDIEQRQKWLLKCVEAFLDQSVSYKKRSFLSKLILHPILMFEYIKNQKIKVLCSATDSSGVAEWLSVVHSKIWKASNLFQGEQASRDLDWLKIELFQLTSVLTSMAKDSMESLRKDVIKFSWSFHKSEDALTKAASYVTICYFISSYSTPTKMKTNMLVTLLRDSNNETKHLVRKGLSLIAPVMSDSDDKNSDKKDINWLRFPRRVISEHGSSLSNLVNVLKFVVSHQDLFFLARDHFVGPSIAAMGKLTMLQNSSDNHILAIEIAETIYHWEKKQKQLKSGTGEKPVPIKESEFATSPTYEIPFGQKEALITFLIRFICLGGPKSSTDSAGRALKVLSDLLSKDYWYEQVTVKLSFFEKFFIEPDFSNANNANVFSHCVNSLEVLSVCLDHKSDDWIVENLSELQNLLEKPIRSDNQDIQEALQKVLARILSSIKDDVSDDQEFEPEPNKYFLGLLVSVISDNLGGMSPTFMAAGVMLCWTVGKYKPDRLTPLFPSIMKTFGKLCRDHVTLVNQSSGSPSSHNVINQNQPNTQPALKGPLILKLLKRVLQFGAARISHLGDQRRIYLSLLAQLIEKTSDNDILARLLNVVYEFVFNRENVFPTSKEKAAILCKMTTFEQRKEVSRSVSISFYKIIIKIFEDDSFLYSDLTQRLEQPFLMGSRYSEVGIRMRFMAIVNDHIEKGIEKRLMYIVKGQAWNFLADYPWLIQATEILSGSFDMSYRVQLGGGEFRFAPLEYLRDVINFEKKDQEVNDNLQSMISQHRKFLKETRNVTAGDIILPLVELTRKTPNKVCNTWVEMFRVAYNSLKEISALDFSRSFSALLANEYHLAQVKLKPNVIQGFLEGAGMCETLHLPPHLVKYLALTFDAYYIGMKLISRVSKSDNAVVKDAADDAYCEILSKLEEKDIFYGVWKERASYKLSKSALSFEQTGMYQKALNFYENIQSEARSGLAQYTDAEYSLWEDNWIGCAEKLQQWDVLGELAKHENYTDLLLESGWRVANWKEDRELLEQTARSIMETPTPRRQLFYSFTMLQGFCLQQKGLGDFTKSIDDGIQLSLAKWFSLPERPTKSHISLLHLFQQFLELNEAGKIYGSMMTANAQNSELKTQDLQKVLTTWRERLPLKWDDISIWGDLTSQRIHIYNLLGVLNRPFLAGANQGQRNTQNFRGFHETAFMINRFAHVSRKQGLPEVCVTQLTKIYSLPNIEIAEAFIKLTEQAKCHYQNVNEINSGLDVIVNTNLSYFNASQRAEFMTLKGMFQAKLNAHEEANQSFTSATKLDNSSANAWSEWGFFNYRLYMQASRSQQRPVQLMKFAKNAITCFMNAQSLFKSYKSRRCLALILWLLSLDDQSGSLSTEVGNFKGEVSIWYWITFIPQLLGCLSHKEGKIASQILLSIGRKYPQALHFALKTTREDLVAAQKHLAIKNFKERSKNDAKESGDKTEDSIENKAKEEESNDVEMKDEIGKKNESPKEEQVKEEKKEVVKAEVESEVKEEKESEKSSESDHAANTSKSSAPENTTDTTSESGSAKQGVVWEYVEKIRSLTKSSYPLLTLSLELLVDQITQRFKCNADEDAYRLVVALLNDGITSYNRVSNPKDDYKLPQQMENHILRLASTVLPKVIRVEFEKDLIQSKPNFLEYLRKLMKWRKRLESKLDRRSTKINLENICPHLTEFHHQKFEPIEVPGQYLLNKDDNSHFIKIERLLPTLEVVRGYASCFKKLQIRGHDGSIHEFSVQFPSNRHSRREERILQFYKLVGDILDRKSQSRSRNIELTTSIIVPLSPHMRIVRNVDDQHISLHKIYEEYCVEAQQQVDQPFFYLASKLKKGFENGQPSSAEVMKTKIATLKSLQTLFAPSNILYSHFSKEYGKYEDFWLFRKQFTSQYASFVFMTYVMSITARQPQKIHIGLKSASVWTSEMLANKSPTPNNTEVFEGSFLTPQLQRVLPVINTNEHVPFRLTPNIVEFIGGVGMEGILSVYVYIMANCVSEPEHALEHILNLFVRDELLSSQQNLQVPLLRELVGVNVRSISNKVKKMSDVENDSSMATENVKKLIDVAVDEKNLAQMDPLWRAYL